MGTQRALQYGLAGCRAPDGRFAFEVAAWPPSKANKYEIITIASHPHLKHAADVSAFIEQMTRAATVALSALPYRVEWFLPPKRKRERPLNPLFGHDIEVDVAVHLYEPLRSDADTDGVLKVTLDVLTAAGIWWDDRQVGDLHVYRVAHVGERAQPVTRIEMQARAQSSWQRNPHARITHAVHASPRVRRARRERTA